MKILFTRFPLESAPGGAEVQTISLMEGLARHGNAMAFAGSCHVLLHLCKQRGIPAVEMRIGPPPVTKRGALSFLWRKRAMRKALIDLLDGFHGLSAIVMLSLTEKLLLTEEASKRGIHVVWVEHDRVGRWLTLNPWLPTLRKLSRKATTVTVSELSRTIYLNLGWDPAKTVAIPNGIDLSRFPLVSLASSDSLRLGCVSRLSPEKGVHILIEAVKDTANVQLEIVGAGRQERELRHLAAGTDRIHLHKHLEDLGQFYASIDALVLPSRDHDPFGLVAAEAMAVGLPVIVTDVCGIAGYLRDGETALIVKAGDRSSLERAIDRLKDPAIRRKLSEKGKEFAHAHFGLETMVEKYVEIMQNAKFEM